MPRFLLTFLLASNAFGFPENILSGRQCGACHVAISGGETGVPLTAYGRGGSDFMYTAARDGEAEAGYGLFSSETSLIGADIRYAYLGDRQFVMAADAGAAMVFKNVTIVGTGGVYGGISDSRTHYAMYTNDSGLYVKFGKFRVNYGINDPDHTLLIKRGLGKDQGSERYQIEASYIGRYGVVSLSGYDAGAVLRGEWFAAEGLSVGVSGEYETTTIPTERHVYRYGGFLLGGTKQGTYLLLEADHELSQTYNELKTGYRFEQKGLGFVKIGHFVMKGLDFSLTREIEYKEESQQDRILAGLRILPRPHLEIIFSGGLYKIDNSSIPISLVMVHLWL